MLLLLFCNNIVAVFFWLHRLVQVDAFTETPFKGNSAAVVVTPAEIGWDDEALLLIAREHNLAETVYVTPLPARSADGGAAFAIRWFTPTAEEVLCGHATLAAAHVLFEHGYAPSGRPISFESKHAGTLTAERVEADSGVEIGLNFPALGLEAVEADERLPGALSGATVVSTMRTDIDDIVVEGESPFYCALLLLPLASSNFLPPPSFFLVADTLSAGLAKLPTPRRCVAWCPTSTLCVTCRGRSTPVVAPLW